jgi:outer membrane biosynthesis protein TonB
MITVLLLASAGCADAPSESSAAEAPATEAPATEAPATEAPATEAPATDASAPGDGDVGAIKKLMSETNYQVKVCYERELKAKPDLAGKVAVSFQIGTDGAVSEATTVANTTGNEAMVACILAVVRGIKMTPPPAEAIVVESYPYVFSSG